MKPSYLLSLLTFLFFSCKSDECPTQPTIINNGEIITNALISIDSSAPEQEYIIRNTEENSIGAKVKLSSEEVFDTINFSTYSLLGKVITFTPDGFITKKNVSINTQNKLVTCTLEKTECGGNHEILLSQNIWILTNKFPDDYEVVFTVIKE